MSARVATWFAIAVGGTGGTLAALFGSSDAAGPAPAASAPLPFRSLARVTASTSAGAGGPAGSGSAPLLAATAPVPIASSVPVVSPSGVAPSQPKSAVPLPAADLLPLPTTKETLLRAEMHCDQRKAEACIVAARSYEGGSAGVTDLEKAAKYRRIALTAWISGCDHNSAAACATLATMYRAGSGVPQSERNANALVERARDLCRFNDSPACHELPPR